MCLLKPFLSFLTPQLFTIFFIQLLSLFLGYTLPSKKLNFSSILLSSPISFILSTFPLSVISYPVLSSPIILSSCMLLWFIHHPSSIISFTTSLYHFIPPRLFSSPLQNLSLLISLLLIVLLLFATPYTL